MLDTDHASPDLWSTCPPDILAKCFRSQQEYVDNSAAACACTSWRDTFRGSAECVTIHRNPLNEGSLSRTYLRQFTRLHTVELRLEGEWPLQDDSSWLTAEEKSLQLNLTKRGLPVWVKIVWTVPTSCCCLKLDGYLPELSFHSVGIFRRLSHLRSLHIHSNHSLSVYLRDFDHLVQLQSLSLVGSRCNESGSMTVQGSLQGLTAGITALQFNHCHAGSSAEKRLLGFCLPALSQLSELTSVDVSHCRVSFGDECEVADLRHITVMVLAGASAPHAESVIASLTTATLLQELNLREFQLDEVGGQDPILQLGRLLPCLPCLQKLDVTHCIHVEVGLSEYTQLRLHSFACTEVPFTPFSQEFCTSQGSEAGPSLQIEVVSHNHCHWLDSLPLTALSHLTLWDAPEGVFPWVLPEKCIEGFNCGGQCMPNLCYLDIRLSSKTTCLGHDVSLLVGSKVRELYVAGTSCQNVDLAHCTSLTSLGIMHRGRTLPGLGLPTGLQRLCLHNVLEADSACDLGFLNNLEYLKLGGRAATKNIMKRLPELPPSLLKLDLWDGVVTDLDQLTLLTKLKHLRMPLAPTPQQLFGIKQLRQLRHIEVTTLQGMYAGSGTVVVPWGHGGLG